jgi:glycosyltransferase involved in cell wall biosynthesis
MNTDTRKLSILMPAYNEGPQIYDNLLHTVNVLSAHPLDFELVVIDDGSCDQTAGEIQKAAAFHPALIKPVLLPENLGKGAALCAGFQQAGGKLIAFLDSDMDLPPAQLVLLLELMELSGADIIVGSKRHPDSTIAYPLHRRLMSEIYYQFVRLLLKLPVRDTQVGIKLFRRPVLEYTLPRLTTCRFAFDVELLSLAATKGFTMKEAPVFINYQCTWGRIGIQSIVQMLKDTLLIFYRLRIKKPAWPEK